LPIVAVSQPNPGAISGSWLGLVAWLTIGYVAHGTGPEIVTDGNLQSVSLRSLQTAAVVAATAVGYDPKFLKVRLLTPTVIDGPSAGGMYAVGIASALLGDAIRRDVCMSGTIEPTFEIKPVGGLADKMNACKTLNKTTMVVPDGLDNSHLSFQGAERAIHVIEVHTLSEAYAAATGQALRHIPPL
jgi:predicted S18 family serine protease